ncbi:branched-chain amino acid transport system II carrier protein [Edaphobacillus lindanitolerans]|uniref:Branched-chain amino acid transport system carrier protein n=1 Tax=Edaphobacillus lindanitolerans TaxID=550447 RepID=A0A1U7PL46_9BACI|nr:branched-chain amino acid transport system II carrier protein [Edaphobacillus lindanitolerans]SIT75983.1 branched-chain amino acid:cation transporter, LIVCS family [Edaphobacillus lindanitolerans]
MQEKLPFSSYLVIGVMLFALFFGAGNLIFPAQLGQLAGDQLWPALIGFLITGVGLPFLSVLAIGYSGSRNLQELASRIHPLYGLLFSAVLYLTIGPFFAAPRTGAVAYEIGIIPFVGQDAGALPLLLFTFVFFGVTLWLSLNPAKIVDRVGKFLAPGIVVLLLILIGFSVFNPLGGIGEVQAPYANGSFVKGFTEGYNTMDAIAALVFAIIVISAVKGMGVTSRKGILNATFKSGLTAIVLLGVLYIGIAWIGATSVEKFGLFKTGGPVLSSAAEHYFGPFGTILMAVVITLACLTTAIGLMTACGEYFSLIVPKIGYKAWVTIFTVFSFVVANFGLSKIITYSIPVLMFLYPLAISLLLLTFSSRLFHHSRLVYVAATAVAFVIGLIDGLKSLAASLETEFGWLNPVIHLFEEYLPLYSDGLGWVVPVVAVMLITGIISRLLGLSSEPASVEA